MIGAQPNPADMKLAAKIGNTNMNTSVNRGILNLAFTTVPLGADSILPARTGAKLFA